MPSLSIVIPTYNRADKLLRLLKNIDVELSNSNLIVQALVSDNASSDDTQEKVTNFKSSRFNLHYYRQEKNIGFDGNVRFLYEAAKTDYVWFFSDDDILLPGAIAMALEGIKATVPDVLLFSFIQPPGSKTRTFNEPNRFAVFTEPKKIIQFVAQYPKVSIYVCRKIELSEAQKRELEPFYENGFYWIDLCYSIIAASSQPKICVISEPLASCDEGFNNIRFDASVCLERYSIFYHPFVRAHLPNMADVSRRQSYYDVIQLMFAVKMGAINSENPELFEKEIRSLQIRVVPLLKNPRSLFQYLLLSLNLVPLFKAYKRIWAFWLP
ncbi:MAG: glycosyltransferase family 2 protein [Nitrosomonadales bacterium]|nr:glycosyltransferase family 2 protein [Nitrosomonadales bacterium]